MEKGAARAVKWRVEDEISHQKQRRHQELHRGVLEADVLLARLAAPAQDEPTEDGKILAPAEFVAANRAA